MNKQTAGQRASALFVFLTTIVMAVAAILTGTRLSRAESPTGTPTSGPTRADLPDLGPAPEITSEVWLNSPKLTLADLRGKVVLVNFWTFGCYNCKNVLPYVRQWHEAYSKGGLVVIGVHYPEFSYESDVSNLQQAIKDLDVTWAVAQDNEGVVWSAYRQRYWPTLYLIDKQGELRYVRIGEGAYDRTEAAINALLNESYTAPVQDGAKASPPTAG